MRISNDRIAPEADSGGLARLDPKLKHPLPTADETGKAASWTEAEASELQLSEVVPHRVV